MPEPVRIQRKREKGWRMPPNTVYVGRPTCYGNPYVVGRDVSSARHAALTYRRWLHGYFDHKPGMCADLMLRDAILAALPALRGKNLACWCPLDEPCHADVLLELANRQRSE